VLILLATDDHKYWTTVGYGLESILPDGKVGGFGREAVPLLKSGNYAGAVTLMTARVASVIAQDAGVTLKISPVGRTSSTICAEWRVPADGGHPHRHLYRFFHSPGDLWARRTPGGGGFWSGLLWGMLFSNMGGGRGGYGGGGFGGGSVAAVVGRIWWFGGGSTGGGGAGGSW